MRVAADAPDEARGVADPYHYHVHANNNDTDGASFQGADDGNDDDGFKADLSHDRPVENDYVGAAAANADEPRDVVDLSHDRGNGNDGTSLPGADDKEKDTTEGEGRAPNAGSAPADVKGAVEQNPVNTVKGSSTTYKRPLTPMCIDPSRNHRSHIAGTFWWASIEGLLCVNEGDYDARAVDSFALAINLLCALQGGPDGREKVKTQKPKENEKTGENKKEEGNEVDAKKEQSHLYGKSTPEDQIVHYFSTIAEYNHELWGPMVDNLAKAYPVTCGNLAERLQNIDKSKLFVPFTKRLEEFCSPQLVDLLEQMLRPNPYDRLPVLLALQHRWFAGIDVRIPFVFIGDDNEPIHILFPDETVCCGWLPFT